MSVLSEQDLKKNIAGTPSRVYLLYGNDDGLKKLYCKKISAKIAAEDDFFNFHRFDGDCDLQQVYDAAMQFPFMSERKCVVLCDYDFEKCGENNFTRLQSLVSGLPDTAVLILWFDSVEIDDKKSSKFKKLLSAVEKAGGAAVKLDHRRADDLVRTLCAAAAKRGCKMETSTARYMLEVCSTDLNILKNEIEKLTAFVGEGTITSETVDAVCVKSVEASVYNISRELTNRNLGNSIRLLDELLFLKIKPHVILSVLSGAFVEMYIGKSAADAGVRPGTAAADFGYKNREFVLTRAADNARRLSEKQMRLCLNELLTADEKLKSTSADGRIVLEELMVKLVTIMAEGESIVEA